MEFGIGTLILALVVVAFLLFAVVCTILLHGKPYPEILRYDEENYFKDPVTGKRHPFPSLQDEPTISLSVIIPAYFEEERLPPMLEECFDYLEHRSRIYSTFSYEVIIVNDGSTDGTCDVALENVKKYGSEKVRLLDLTKNRGKGGAVRLGVQSSRGSCILFADADGATKFSDLDKMYASLNETVAKAKFEAHEFPTIICGSRAHLEEDAIAARSFFRTILMHGFHLLVWFFTVRGIRDTQCGFKLFTRAAARICFPSLHIERWAFDVELLYIAQTLHIPVDEVSVTWTEIEGSKVTPIWSWLQMGRDLILIWLRYKIGAWKLVTKED